MLFDFFILYKTNFNRVTPSLQKREREKRKLNLLNVSMKIILVTFNS